VTAAGELWFSWPGRFLAVVLPTLTAVCLVILANTPVSFTGYLLPAPVLALAAVYFWVLVRPDLMPPLAVLAIGSLEDLLSGGPPGLWAAGFLAAYVLTDRQRETFAGLTGLGAVVAFAGVMLLAGSTAYGLACVVSMRWAPLPPLLLECVTTVAFYPLVVRPMGWVQRKFVGSLRNGA